MKQLGGRIKPEHLQSYQNSKHWNKGTFQNLQVTYMDVNLKTLPDILYQQLFKTKGRSPVKPIPTVPFELKPNAQTQFAWFGHSALFIQTQGLNILIDPMLGDDAAPIAPFKVKRFSNNTLAYAEALPTIDVMLISHDHYDHLDYASIMALQSKTKKYYVALGVKRHLVSWGIPAEIITEFDWWENHPFENLKIHFTPSRHFSGRGLSDRAKCMWGGWVIESATEKIYFSGDSGYGKHFKEVGERLGPFNIGFMENGQYNAYWHQIHMFPEEAVKAALDAQVHVAVPVHWAGFALALHHWKDPIERFQQAAKEANLSTYYPQIGEVFGLGKPQDGFWWEELN